MTDSNGTLVATYQYDPSGNLTSITGNIANPWRYASGYLDSSTGLYKFGARYYDATIGRWTQQDQVAGNPADPTSLDRYVYAGDDPVNEVDSSGQCAGAQSISSSSNGFTIILLNECTVQAIEGSLWVGAGATGIAALILGAFKLLPLALVFGVAAGLFTIGAGALQIIDGLGSNQGLLIIVRNGQILAIGPQ